MSNVVYMNNEESRASQGAQRFYIFHEKHGEVIHSTVDVNALFDLFKNKNVSLSEESLANLDQAVITAVDDFYCNFKAELSLHQLLTITALFCSNSEKYSEFKTENPAREVGFSYFITIIENNSGEYVLNDNILPFHRLVEGDLLDDILDGMILNHKKTMKSEFSKASVAQSII